MTVLDAKLRLYQTSANPAGTLGACIVDIQKGSFHNNRALETLDYNASASAVDAARVRPLADSPPAWVEAELLPQDVQYINNSTVFMGRTQFRLHYDGTGSSKAQWNSGATDSSNPSTPPQLIVRYAP